MQSWIPRPEIEIIIFRPPEKNLKIKNKTRYYLVYLNNIDDYENISILDCTDITNSENNSIENKIKNTPRFENLETKSVTILILSFRSYAAKKCKPR